MHIDVDVHELGSLDSFLRTCKRYEERYLISAAQINSFCAMRPGVLRDYLLGKRYIERVPKTDKDIYRISDHGRKYGLVSRRRHFYKISSILMAIKTGDCLMQQIMADMEDERATH
jgi:hypothetical protein